MENRYEKLRKKQQEEYNEFSKHNIFYAFSEEQFDEGLKEFGLTRNTMKNKLVRLGGTGGYLLKDKEQEFDDLQTRHKWEIEQEIRQDKTGRKFIKDMFLDEMANHEFGYTRDLTDTLNALGLTLKQIEQNANLTKGLQLAIAKYN